MTVTPLRDPPDSARGAAVWWGGLALALAAFLAVSARATGGGEDAAEIHHLGVLGLLCLASLLPSGFRTLRPSAAAVALIFTLAVWVLPQGLLRSGTAALVLAVGWSLAASTVAARDRASTVQLVGLALALQVLQRGEVLVTESSLKAGFIVFVLPVVFGASIAALQTRYGRAAPLTGLLVLCATGEITTAAALTVAAAAATVWEAETGARILAVGIGVLAISWSPPIGVLALLAALYLLRVPRWAAALFVAGGVLLAFAAVRVWDLPQELALLFLCAPFLWSGSAAARAPLAPLAATLGLALVGLRFLAPHEALIAPLLVLGLAGREPIDDVWRRGQTAWALTLVGLGAVLANYPWHRDTDLGALLASDPWPLGLALAAVLVTAPRQAGFRLGALAVALVVLAVLPIARPRSVLLDWPPVTLDADSPAWQADLPDGGSAGTLRILVDSRLADAEELSVGTRLATLELVDADGRAVQSWPLRSGLETAEWSADRDGHPRPGSFSSAIAATGDFFGRRYRAVLSAQIPTGSTTLRLRVEPTELGEARLELHHVAIERPLLRGAM